MKKVYSFCFTIILLFIGCNGPQDVGSPTHFTRVPRAYGFNVTSDTTVTGKYRISLKWQTDPSENLRSFEVFRAYTAPVKFSVLQPAVTAPAFVDSFAAEIPDSLQIFYYVIATGKDRFVGQSSDIYSVTIKKK